MRTLNEIKEQLKQLREEVKRYEEIEVKMLEWVLNIK